VTPALTVVTWLWRQDGYPTRFLPHHVNILRRMVARHLPLPHRFACFAESPRHLENGILHLPLPPAPPIEVREGRPNCFRRLWAFSSEASEVGERILSIDLDTVITREITPLIRRDEDIVLWKGTARNTPYNGGLWLLRTRSRTHVWTEFLADPLAAWQRIQEAELVGSDQAWMALALGPDEATWSKSDGVYSFRNDMRWRPGPGDPPPPLPQNARVVSFHGRHNPWDERVQWEYPWVKEHYR
jgi:hypothetical protein